MFFFFFFFKDLFLLFFWLWWVSVAAQGLCLVAASRGYFLVAVCGLLTVVSCLAEEHRPWSMWPE